MGGYVYYSITCREKSVHKLFWGWKLVLCTFLLDNHVTHLMAGNAPVGWAECYGGRILSQEGVCQSKGKTFGENIQNGIPCTDYDKANESVNEIIRQIEKKPWELKERFESIGPYFNNMSLPWRQSRLMFHSILLLWNLTFRVAKKSENFPYNNPFWQVRIYLAFLIELVIVLCSKLPESNAIF